MRLEPAPVFQLPEAPRAPVRRALARLARLGALLALTTCTTQEKAWFFIVNKTSAPLTLHFDDPDGGFRGTPWPLLPGEEANYIYSVGGCNPFYPGEYKLRHAFAAGFTIEDAQGRRKHLPLDEILRRRERFPGGWSSNDDYALELHDSDLSK
jgi:hypothetical protein